MSEFESLIDDLPYIKVAKITLVHAKTILGSADNKTFESASILIYFLVYFRNCKKLSSAFPNYHLLLDAGERFMILIEEISRDIK